jgi:hypothetical protein
VSGEVWYLAHPVAGDVQANVQRALRWLAWLRREEPTACLIAPWLAALLAGEDDTDPAQRERGMRDNLLVAERCDGIVLVGGRISAGMQRELDLIAHGGGRVCDLVRLGDEPPTDAQLDAYFAAAERADRFAPPRTVYELGALWWEAR